MERWWGDGTALGGGGGFRPRPFLPRPSAVGPAPPAAARGSRRRARSGGGRGFRHGRAAQPAGGSRPPGHEETGRRGARQPRLRAAPQPWARPLALASLLGQPRPRRDQRATGARPARARRRGEYRSPHPSCRRSAEPSARGCSPGQPPVPGSVPPRQVLGPVSRGLPAAGEAEPPFGARRGHPRGTSSPRPSRPGSAPGAAASCGEERGENRPGGAAGTEGAAAGRAGGKQPAPVYPLMSPRREGPPGAPGPWRVRGPGGDF